MFDVHRHAYRTQHPTAGRRHTHARCHRAAAAWRKPLIPQLTLAAAAALCTWQLVVVWGQRRHCWRVVNSCVCAEAAALVTVSVDCTCGLLCLCTSTRPPAATTANGSATTAQQSRVMPAKKRQLNSAQRGDAVRRVGLRTPITTSGELLNALRRTQQGKQLHALQCRADCWFEPIQPTQHAAISPNTLT